MSKKFEEYLKTKGLDVQNGRILIKDIAQAYRYSHEYELLSAREAGLPKKFAPFADQIFSISFENMERNNQDPYKYGCELTYSSKNYDEDDTWNGIVKGTLKQIWEWAINESSLSPDTIIADIEDVVIHKTNYE